MGDLDFGEGLRKVFLAGVRALATTVAKSQEIVDGPVTKGEITVEQGKALNTELKRRATNVKNAAQGKTGDDELHRSAADGSGPVDGGDAASGDGTDGTTDAD